MATREGIYVGGHEIVERYVGSRLVWEKFKLVLIGSFPYNFTSSNANSNSVEYIIRNANGFYGSGGYGPTRSEGYEAYRSTIVVERNGHKFKNVSVSIESRTEISNSTNVRIIIYFSNPEDKNKFLSKYDSTLFFKKKR